MNITQFIKAIKYLFFLSTIIFILWLSYAIWQTRNLSKKFNKTKLNISYKELIKDWGKPDEEFDMNLNYDKRHIIKYNDIIGYSYIFASKKGEEIISEKYIDD